jgi:hypothetical protein
MSWSGLWGAYRRYQAHPDPLVAASNSIALLIGSSQPFFPLYVWYLVSGEAARISLLTFLTTPFFLAVPFVSRRNGTVGKTLLVVTGAANTFACAKYFGPSSAVETFLLPCAMLATLSFRRAEYAVALTLLGGGLAAFLLFQGGYGTPLAALSAAEAASFASLNIYSVAVLTAWIGWTFASAQER